MVFSSQIKKRDFILEIYKDRRTVFGLSDIAMLFSEENNKRLSDRIAYYVQTNRLLNLRKGIYAKSDYNYFDNINRSERGVKKTKNEKAF